MSDILKSYLHETGLHDEGVREDMIKVINDDEYVVIKPLLFHWTMIRGSLLDLVGYDDRWCYADEDSARIAFDAFPDRPDPGYEPDGWHRHPKTGRRRERGEPETEYHMM